ncbi:hypothetical protein N2152v2_006088 [Parachlorella kessleri]
MDSMHAAGRKDWRHGADMLPPLSAVQQYGGFKSVDKLFAQPQRQGVVGRWDWHFWHFLLALIPPGVVVLLAHLARNDMAAKQLERNRKATEETLQMLEAAQKLKDVRAAGAAGQTEQLGSGDGGSHQAQPRDETQDMRRRLAELEATVKELAAMQPLPHAAATAGDEPAQGSGHGTVNGGSALSSGASAEVTSSSKGLASTRSSPLAAAPTPNAGHIPPANPPPLPKLPDNPLDRWLPETDCQFCNDTRQRLWGAFKSTTGYKSAYDKGQAKREGAAAAEEGLRARSGVAATAAEVPGGSAAERHLASAPAPQQAGKMSGDKPQHSQRQGLPEEAERQSSLAVGEELTAAPTGEADSQRRRDDGAPAVAASGAAEHADNGPEARRSAAPSESSPGPVLEAAPGWEPAQASAATAAPQTPGNSGSHGAASDSPPPPAGAAAAGVATAVPAGKAPPLPKLPDNPLDRWLPETDCQFCNDTRQQLWGAFKAAAGVKGAPGKGQQSGSQETREETNPPRSP